MVAKLKKRLNLPSFAQFIDSKYKSLKNYAVLKIVKTLLFSNVLTKMFWSFSLENLFVVFFNIIIVKNKKNN